MAMLLDVMGADVLFAAARWTGRALAAILLAAGCGGMCFGGRLSDRWQRPGLKEAPTRVMVIGAVGCIVLLPIGTLLSSEAWTIALLWAGALRVHPEHRRPKPRPAAAGRVQRLSFHDGARIGCSLAITMGGAAVLMLVTLLAAYPHHRAHYRLMQTATAAA